MVLVNCESIVCFTFPIKILFYNKLTELGVLLQEVQNKPCAGVHDAEHMYIHVSTTFIAAKENALSLCG
jgi:hypothetical protein